MKYESESLPRGWTDAALGDLGEWIGGGTPSKSRVDFWENGSIPWISPKDMKTDVVTGAADYITEDAVQDSATQLLPSGAVLFVVRSGILGRTLPVAVTTFPATINQDLKALIPSCLISSQYVMNFVRARENDILEYARKAGTTVASLNVERLKTYPIPIPPIAEQKRILARLREMLARTRTARETLEAVPALLEQFRQSVLAAAFRGDLT
ncbi:MAG TPA: restriction endonuclease subunit S, partial [Longimicrobiaceae bacterium]|nr:restriction endonuclease subunit S [Longimicrobiaceae bacterium]